MRRAGFALLTMSMAAAACGRIVTVPPTGSSGSLVPAGNMFIRYRVEGTLDFVNVHYLVVFNTSGNGITPYAAPGLQQFANYSFILVFGGTAAAGAAYALLQVVNSGTSSGFQTVSLGITPAFITNFNANSSGTGNEFTFTFNRNLLTAIATSSPTPTPSASPTPAAYPTLLSGQSSLWAINCFTADPSNNPIDAISPVNGINDTTFSSFVINTLQPFDVPVNKSTPPVYQVANPNAQLIAVEIINTP
jgi:hypothetical protein